MSSNLSSVYLVGNVVKQPEKVFSTEDKSRVLVTFRMAMNHRYVGVDGHWRDGETCFIDVQCWNRLGSNVADTICKGTPVIVIGRLVQSNWEVEEDGRTSKRSIIRVKATHVGPDLNTRRGSFYKNSDLTGQENQPEVEQPDASQAGEDPEVAELSEGADVAAHLVEDSAPEQRGLVGSAAGSDVSTGPRPPF